MPSRLLNAALVAGLALFGVACGSDDDPSAEAPTTVTDEVTSSSAGTSSSSSSSSPSSSSATTTATTSTGPESVTMAGETVSAVRLRAIAAGLCEALSQAPTDVAAAKKTFNSRSHDGLHLIARGLQEVDRPAAAALLEAKQKVEADLSRSAPGSELAAHLRTLADVTRSGLARFDVSVDACPSS